MENVVKVVWINIVISTISALSGASLLFSFLYNVCQVRTLLLYVFLSFSLFIHVLQTHSEDLVTAAVLLHRSKWKKESHLFQNCSCITEGPSKIALYESIYCGNILYKQVNVVTEKLSDFRRLLGLAAQNHKK